MRFQFTGGNPEDEFSNTWLNKNNTLCIEFALFVHTMKYFQF